MMHNTQRKAVNAVDSLLRRKQSERFSGAVTIRIRLNDGNVAAVEQIGAPPVADLLRP